MEMAGTPERGMAASWESMRSGEVTCNTLQNRDFQLGASSPQALDECLNLQRAGPQPFVMSFLKVWDAQATAIPEQRRRAGIPHDWTHSGRPWVHEFKRAYTSARRHCPGRASQTTLFEEFLPLARRADVETSNGGSAPACES